MFERETATILSTDGFTGAGTFILVQPDWCSVSQLAPDLGSRGKLAWVRGHPHLTYIHLGPAFEAGRVKGHKPSSQLSLSTTVERLWDRQAVRMKESTHRC